MTMQPFFQECEVQIYSHIKCRPSLAVCTPRHGKVEEYTKNNFTKNILSIWVQSCLKFSLYIYHQIGFLISLTMPNASVRLQKKNNSFSDSDVIRTHTNLVYKRTLNHLAKPVV